MITQQWHSVCHIQKKAKKEINVAVDDWNVYIQRNTQTPLSKFNGMLSCHAPKIFDDNLQNSQSLMFKVFHNVLKWRYNSIINSCGDH